ncbi:MAG: nucleotidyltransferase domain-containing protein [Bacteroidota bacterium]|nr:nucleotidyltransferase domain-containing protein [Bacteroidota bacterium]
MNREYIIQSIKSIKPFLQENGISTIGIFGSYSFSEATESSDIDILIDFEKNKETFSNFLTVCEALENLFPNKKTDIVTTKGLNKYIGPLIMNQVIYV